MLGISKGVGNFFLCDDFILLRQKNSLKKVQEALRYRARKGKNCSQIPEEIFFKLQ
jgi:hypothetical protein